MKQSSISAALLGLVAATSSCSDELPGPLRTPPGLAAYYSGVPVPKNVEVMKVEDTFMTPNPDSLLLLQGHVWVELHVPKDSMARMYEAAMKLGFRPIQSAGGDTLASLRLNKNRTGIFFYARGVVSANERITVLDSSDHYMWVFYEQISNKW